MYTPTHAGIRRGREREREREREEREGGERGRRERGGGVTKRTITITSTIPETIKTYWTSSPSTLWTQGLRSAHFIATADPSGGGGAYINKNINNQSANQ